MRVRGLAKIGNVGRRLQETLKTKALMVGSKNDMCTMPIRSESNQINTIKQKKSKKCEGPGQPVLLGPPKCEREMKYDEV